MSDHHQRRAGSQQPARRAVAFAVGERVRITGAPGSYGYNGRAGVVAAIDGAQISVQVDQHPADFHCTTFYAEELEREAES